MKPRNKIKLFLSQVFNAVSNLECQLLCLFYRIEYFDDLALDEGSSVDDVHKWEPSAISHKNISMEGIQIFSDEFTRLSRQCSSSDIGSEPTSPTSASVMCIIYSLYFTGLVSI